MRAASVRVGWPFVLVGLSLNTFEQLPTAAICGTIRDNSGLLSNPLQRAISPGVYAGDTCQFEPEPVSTGFSIKGFSQTKC
jgi:hypothetical protein